MNLSSSHKITAAIAVGLFTLPVLLGAVNPAPNASAQPRLASAQAHASLHFLTAHTFRVQPGDTLSGIAAQFQVSVSQLVSWNNIANPNSIRVGQVLNVSGSATASSPVATSEQPAVSSKGSQVVVEPGNTLGTIAQRFGISWQYLAAFNHLANPNILEIGQVLNIPSGTQNSGNATASLPVQNPSVNFGQAIVQTAEQYLGVPYVWGGASPQTGFDCSGLVQYVFRQNGIPMPRTSWAQYSYVTKIPKSQLQPGDLVFFSTDGPGASHVGIYIGADPALGYSQAFEEAPEPGQNVMISNLNDPFYVSHYYGAGTVTP